MKPTLIWLCVAALAANLPLAAQTTVAPGAANTGLPAAAPNTDALAKEKAEDDALLQQMETDPPQGGAKNVRRVPATTLFRSGDAFVQAGGGGISYRTQDLLTRPLSAARPLVVRTSDLEPRTQNDLEEDLTVMSHLLSKALDELPGGPGPSSKIMGIDVVFASAAAPLRSLYLDGYGALFFLNVNFPLLSPPEKNEQKPAADSAWEDAREEVYGQRSTGAVFGGVSEEFSEEKVSRLKSTLLDALKNATNIRGLKPSDFITIVVSGGSNGGFARFRRAGHKPPAALGGKVMVGESKAAPTRRTVLTLRVTKGQIDDYAKGKITAENFQKQVTMATYSDEGGGAPEMLVGESYGRGF